MAAKVFFLSNDDCSNWIITYDAEAEQRAAYSLRGWLNGNEPEAKNEEVGGWLESKGSSIEMVFPFNDDGKTVNFDVDEALEYTELLDDIRMFG
ncbi:MAG: hypothetical protein P9L94_17035 [Candidatus Hinthialibacter antarcticus]|nr:hypothetical protein [Candidatus Hinthialibacter antarcticus]